METPTKERTNAQNSVSSLRPLRAFAANPPFPDFRFDAASHLTSRKAILRGLLIWFFAACLSRTQAATPAQDPLMSLMLSQPRIDVESPVVPEVSFDPPVVRPGQESIYRVAFNALDESIAWPDKIPAPPALSVQPGGHAQMLSLGGPTPVFLPRTGFNYHVRASGTGQFTIPAFTVNVYGKAVTVPAAQLLVETTPTNGPALPQQLGLEVAQANLFVGQAVWVTVTCPGFPAPLLQGTTPVQLMGSGFIIDQSAFRQRHEARPRFLTGGQGVVLVFETFLTPIASGKLTVFAQGFIGARPPGPLIITGPSFSSAAQPQYTLLDSDPLNLTVRPLPAEGRLPGFTGAVGAYGIDSPEISTNQGRVGEPLKLTVRVRGEGDLARLVAPPPPKTREWQILPATPDNMPPQFIQLQGFTTLQFTLIPLSDHVRGTPPIPFSSFNPDRAAYEDLTIPSVPVTVQSGSIPADLQVLLQANAADADEEKEPVLSGLAATPGLVAGSLVPLQRQIWYPLVQLAPGAAFLALWGWDRRRRFLQEHSDILLRKRARRALRHEWRALQKAARTGDSARFASASVSAMRVACAPHFPAEPRALVGSDVLALLPETERSGRTGQVVRRFFTAADDSRFAPAPSQSLQILELKPELEQVLHELEARL